MDKAIYELKRYHHQKCYRNGDLEDETVVDFMQVFPTRTAANNYLMSEESSARRRGFSTDITIVKRGAASSELLIDTHNNWVNENSGEDCSETLWYVVEKKFN